MTSTIWRRRSVRIVVPLETMRAIYSRAQQYSPARGGRYTTDPTAIHLGSKRPGQAHLLVASVQFDWRQPRADQATISQLAWDGHRCSESEVVEALNWLAGEPVL